MLTVDARGDQCPIPVIKAKKALETLKKGEMLTVLVDNEIAVQNLNKLAVQKEAEFRWEKRDENHYETIFTAGEEKENSADVSIEEMGISCEVPGATQKKNRIVVIASNQMGVGEEALGKTLLKGFLYALTQQERLPDCILFYNGGAAITCEGSDSIEDLRWLEEQGVEILTCGTCLNFYGIADQLVVGKPTNMYEIVQKMTTADQIIKP